MRQIRFVALFTIIAIDVISLAQNSYLDEPGIPAFTTAFPVEHGFINLANGNLHIEIPIASYPQRGNIKVLHARLVYDSRFWTYDPNYVDNNLQFAWNPNGVPSGPGLGWRLLTDGEAGSVKVSQTFSQCGCSGICGNPSTKTTYSNYIYQEPNGTNHRTDGSFKLYSSPPVCGGLAATGTAYTTDNTGYKFVVTNGNPVVYAPDGTQVTPTLQDTNGNVFGVNSGQGYAVVDTLGRTPVISTTSGNQVFLDYLNPQGARSRATITLAPINLATQFGTGGEYTGTLQAVQSIALPDGSSYQFQYDSYGQITSMTLPTGGQVTYGYTNITVAKINRWVTSRTVDGNTWTFAPATVTCTAPCSTLAVTVTTPPYNDGNTTASDNRVYSFIVANGAWPTQIQYFRGAASGTPVLTITKEYNNGTNNSCQQPMGGGTGAAAVLIRETLIWPTGSGTLSKKAEYCYDTLGVNLTIKKLWDYQTGSFAATADREIDNVYVTDAAYVNANIINLIKSTTVKNSTGTQVAQTTYGYDESTVQASGVTTQLNPPTGPRGNLTSAGRWLGTNNTFVTSNTKWYDTGEVYQFIDPLTNATTFTYDSSLAGAYPTKICNALNQCTYKAYDHNTGLLTAFTDPNGSGAGDAAHTTTHTYDLMLRQLCSSLPDGGQTCASYPDPNHITQQKKMTATLTDTATTVLDGLGRTIETQHTLPNGVAKVDTTYDPLGVPATVSNPYFTTSDPTYGVVQTFHDALERTVKTIKQDGSVTMIVYSLSSSGGVIGPCATKIDDAGKQKKSCTNAQGLIAAVWEDPNGLNYETDYQYDALGDLLRVDQKGSAPTDSTQWRTRTFTYDSLSRLLMVNNPESGTISYSYDANGNVLTKTDARGVVTTLTYDALNRMTYKSYSDGTAPVGYGYDQTSNWGKTLQNAVGRLTTEGNGTTGDIFSYDVMGRLVNQWSAAPSNYGGVPDPTVAAYDLAGNLTSLNYPSGRVIKFAYNSADQLNQVTFDNWNGTPVGYNYWSVSDTNFYPNGTPRIASLGNGVTESVILNKRLQPQQDTVSNTSIGTLSDRVYNYGAQDNGNILSVTDQLNSARTQTFTYDPLNRLASANESRWGMNYVYDAWGNYLQQNQTTGTGYQHQYASLTNNRLSGYSYDAAGNLLNDGFHNYVYDADSRIKQVDTSGATYTYDADGNRVRKDVSGSPSTEYIYFNGNVIAERTVGTSDWSDYIFANGKRITKAPNYENRILIAGTNCSTCGPQSTLFTFGGVPWLPYVVQSGDRLFVRMKEDSGSGGVVLGFSDGTTTRGSLADTGGVLLNTDNPSVSWHVRIADLSAYAGKTLTSVALVAETTSGPGAWQLKYKETALMSGDGTVRPIYVNETSVSLTPSATSGVTGVTSTINHNLGPGAPPNTGATYYHGDQIGSSRLMTADGGYPVWQGTFLPYGEEYNPQITTNHYKFTGKERDSESGLDYFGARYYGSGLGRFITPDWAAKATAVPYADFADPQSLNLYTYVRNIPTTNVDADGHAVGEMSERYWAVDPPTITMWFGDASTLAVIRGGAAAASSTEEGASQSGSAPGNAGPKLGIGIEVPPQSAVSNNVLNVAADPGHTFVYVKNASGAIVSILSFGPHEAIGAANKTTFQNGHLAGNVHWQLHGNASVWEFAITAHQMNVAKQAIAEFKSQLPNYTPTVQCSSASLSIATKIGLNLPSGMGPVIARIYVDVPGTSGMVRVPYTFYTGTAVNPYHLNQQMTTAHGPPVVVNTRVFPAP